MQLSHSCRPNLMLNFVKIWSNSIPKDRIRFAIFTVFFIILW